MATPAKRRVSQSMPAQERIRIVAQRLFAKHGYEAVPVRMITEKAGVNIAAINYYFGSKDQLFVAVVRHHMVAALEKRTERLAALEAAHDATGEPPELESIIDSWLGPTLDLFYRDSDGPAIVRLAMQLNTVIGSDSMASVLEPYREYFRRLCRLISACMPDMKQDEIIWRWECLTGMIFYSMAQPDWQHRVPPDYCNIEDESLLHRRLMESALALFGRTGKQ